MGKIPYRQGESDLCMAEAKVDFVRLPGDLRVILQGEASRREKGTLPLAIVLTFAVSIALI